jgi:hypothetical protein
VPLTPSSAVRSAHSMAAMQEPDAMRMTAVLVAVALTVAAYPAWLGWDQQRKQWAHRH